MQRVQAGDGSFSREAIMNSPSTPLAFGMEFCSNFVMGDVNHEEESIFLDECNDGIAHAAKEQVQS